MRPDGAHLKSQKLDGGGGGSGGDSFNRLHDELVLSVLCQLSSSAGSPSDLLAVMLTCKRLKKLALDPLVLSRASSKCFEIRADRWSRSCDRFLKRCADAGNLEALYFLGMIRFYCLEMRKSGTSLMARAALGSHAEAFFSLAVIKFNGTGADVSTKSARDGFALCARAALLGHVDAIREVGYCLRDGYGVARDVAEGDKLLLRAAASEVVGLKSGLERVADPHPANRFLKQWWVGSGCGSGLCSYGECGRRESRRHEFRKCEVCKGASYCSRACQVRDWRWAHNRECRRVDVWGEDLFVEGN